MRVRCLVIVFLLFVYAAPSLAATITARWELSAGATGYKLYQSVDQGVTWTLLADVVGGTVQERAVTVPDTGLILIRASAYNAQGEAIRHESGVFYNTKWHVPSAASQLGVK